MSEARDGEHTPAAEPETDKARHKAEDALQAEALEAQVAEADPTEPR